MYPNAKWQEEYEKRFNAYMFKIINNTYKRYITKRRKEIAELTLNEYVGEDTEFVDTLQGDSAPVIEERFTEDELELIVEDEKLYKILKSLTSNERSVIFLSIISKWNYKRIAKKLKIHENSVGRIYKKAKKKIKKLIGRMVK